MTPPGVDGKRSALLLGALLAGVVAYGFPAHIDNLMLSYAWKGWSPLQFVNLVLLPGNFLHNFPSGAEAYGQSALLWVYPLAKQCLGIPPEALIPWLVALEYTALALAVLFLGRTLFSGRGLFAGALAALLLICTQVWNLDLARVGIGFTGTFWAIPTACNLAALGCALRAKHVAAALLLCLSYVVHPLLGLAGAAFAFGILLTQGARARTIPVLAGIVLFLAVAGSWTFFFVGMGQVSGGTIDPALWTGLTKMTNYHWYAWELGMFTSAHANRFMQFLGFLLLFAYCLPGSSAPQEARRAVAAGVSILLALAAAGILIPVTTSNPTLIRLSLHRCSQLIIPVCLLFIVEGLLRDVARGPWWHRATALMLLLSPFFVRGYHPGFPIAVCWLHAAPAWLPGGGTREQHDSPRIPMAIASLLVLLLFGAYYANGLLKPWDTYGYTGGAAYLAWLAAALPCMAALSLAERRGADTRRVLDLAVLALVAGLCLANAHKDARNTAASQARRDFLEAQLWAKEHTAPQALFMIDPGLAYGWRDFSQRSSFGTTREWLFTSWLYTSNHALLREGLRRLDELGLQVSDYMGFDPALQGWRQLRQDSQQRFYAEDDAWRRGMASRHGIDYFVMQKKYLRPTSRMPVVHENAHFAILAANAPPAAARSGAHLTLKQSLAPLFDVAAIPSAPDAKRVEMDVVQGDDGREALSVRPAAARTSCTFRMPCAQAAQDCRFEATSAPGTIVVDVTAMGHGRITATILWWDKNQARHSARLEPRYLHPHGFRGMGWVFPLPGEAVSYALSFSLHSGDASPPMVLVRRYAVHEATEQ